MRLPSRSIIFGHDNLLDASGGLKGNHELQYHLYRILDDVDLKDAFPYGE